MRDAHNMKDLFLCPWDICTEAGNWNHYYIIISIGNCGLLAVLQKNVHSVMFGLLLSIFGFSCSSHSKDDNASRQCRFVSTISWNVFYMTLVHFNCFDFAKNSIELLRYLIFNNVCFTYAVCHLYKFHWFISFSTKSMISFLCLTTHCFISHHRIFFLCRLLHILLTDEWLLLPFQSFIIDTLCQVITLLRNQRWKCIPINGFSTRNKKKPKASTYRNYITNRTWHWDTPQSNQK